MNRFGSKAATAIAALLFGLIVSDPAAAGQAVRGKHGQIATHVGGATIHITLGAVPVVVSKGRQRNRHGSHHAERGHGYGYGHGDKRGHGYRNRVAATSYGTPNRIGHRMHSGALRGCQPTSKIVFVGRGQRAKIGGLMCQDRHGRPFILKGSRHVLYYD